MRAGATSLSSIFLQYTQGIKTNRDAWCFNSSTEALRANIRRSVDFYNIQVEAFVTTYSVNNTSQNKRKAKAFVTKNETQFHWSRENYGDVAKRIRYTFNEGNIRVALYRPFFKQRVYFDRRLNNSVYKFPALFPAPHLGNLGIYVTGPGSTVPFTALMSDSITDLGLTSGNGASPYFPRYWYKLKDVHSLAGFDESALTCMSNINPDAVLECCQQYNDTTISEDDLYYYTYGVLHSQQWRDTFANDLDKESARVSQWQQHWMTSALLPMRVVN